MKLRYAWLASTFGACVAATLFAASAWVFLAFDRGAEGHAVSWHEIGPAVVALAGFALFFGAPLAWAIGVPVLAALPPQASMQWCRIALAGSVGGLLAGAGFWIGVAYAQPLRAAVVALLAAAVGATGGLGAGAAAMFMQRRRGS